MKRLLGIIMVAAGCGAAGADDEGIDWRTDVDKGRSEARKSGMPMLVVFR